MSSHQLQAYKIEVLDFSKKNGNHHSDAVYIDKNGIYQCVRCGWEGYWEKQCPKCDNKELHSKSRIKAVDAMPVAPRRTLVELFYKYEQALRFGQRHGTVISCHKVDKSYYLENIEHLNLHQEPLTIEVEQEEDFVLSRTLELERPRRKYNEEKYNIEVDDKKVLDKP